MSPFTRKFTRKVHPLEINTRLGSHTLSCQMQRRHRNTPKHACSYRVCLVLIIAPNTLLSSKSRNLGTRPPSSGVHIGDLPLPWPQRHFRRRPQYHVAASPRGWANGPFAAPHTLAVGLTSVEIVPRDVLTWPADPICQHSSQQLSDQFAHLLWVWVLDGLGKSEQSEERGGCCGLSCAPFRFPLCSSGTCVTRNSKSA